MKLHVGTIVLGGALAAAGQQPGIAGPVKDAGALFVTPQSALHRPVTVIAYGDTRFTDPANVTATNPPARRGLVAKIVQERPDALLVSGDLPYRGGVPEDYAVFRSETAPWREAGIRLYPALGNHEFAKCEPEVCLANWWGAFPEMPELRGRRWYSAQLGDAMYVLNLDSDTSLLPGSPQATWLAAQVAGLPGSVRFVLLNLHHPPVADVQTRTHMDHNPRPNEMALRDYLAGVARVSKARFVVVAGHIHNYERFEQDGVLYFVSGGGGAQPYEVDRTPADLYKGNEFPNYHYLRFTVEGKRLKGEMVRLKDASAATPEWEVRDRFEVKAK
ncbi:MAG: metallophosphoesterase [Acidobacteriota bacterium]|nr:metallophosphoesterase [Acidobacteriota bacterium]